MSERMLAGVWCGHEAQERNQRSLETKREDKRKMLFDTRPGINSRKHRAIQRKAVRGTGQLAPVESGGLTARAEMGPLVSRIARILILRKRAAGRNGAAEIWDLLCQGGTAQPAAPPSKRAREAVYATQRPGLRNAGRRQDSESQEPAPGAAVLLLLQPVQAEIRSEPTAVCAQVRLERPGKGGHVVESASTPELRAPALHPVVSCCWPRAARGRRVSSVAELRNLGSVGALI